jgi:hypothetical protein
MVGSPCINVISTYYQFVGPKVENIGIDPCTVNNGLGPRYAGVDRLVMTTSRGLSVSNANLSFKPSSHCFCVNPSA